MPTLPEKNEFEMCPAGTHVGRCYRVIEMGTIKKPWEEEGERPKSYIRIAWELDALMDDGRPYVIDREYPLSSHEKSNLIKHLVAWRGKPFSDEDWGKFRIENVVGAYAIVNVVHYTDAKGHERCKVESLSPLMKGMTKFDPINDNMILNLTKNEFDVSAFESLPEWLRDQIKTSPEYLECVGQVQIPETANISATEDDDDLPF